MEGAPQENRGEEKIPTKLEVLEIVRKEEGNLSPETREMIGNWFENLRKQETSGEETVRSLIQLAEVYIMARDFKGAEETLADAMENARQEDSRTSYEEAQQMLNKMDRQRE